MSSFIIFITSSFHMSKWLFDRKVHLTFGLVEFFLFIQLRWRTKTKNSLKTICSISKCVTHQFLCAYKMFQIKTSLFILNEFPKKYVTSQYFATNAYFVVSLLYFKNSLYLFTQPYFHFMWNIKINGSKPLM